DNNDVIPHYPSSYTVPNIIAVASTDHSDLMSSFSCYGVTSVDVAAPGSSILSTWPGGGYNTISGTSMATPCVAGACALLKSLKPTMSAVELKQNVLACVDPLASLAGTIVTGGRINVYTLLLPHVGALVVFDATIMGRIMGGVNPAVIIENAQTVYSLPSWQGDVSIPDISYQSIKIKGESDPQLDPGNFLRTTVIIQQANVPLGGG
ncbi:MAG: S8 family serine peptidase, partial [Planctomycetes bacterium]|nr:S8 family serine peptidase [Planctomycetota bacterium]